MSEAPKPVIPGYELKHELGTGGMATVYLAVQTSLDRKVAIKVMHVSSKDEEGPERIEKRFLREGRMLARLSHRNVCGIYDIAKVGDIAYIAMEYLDGGTLTDRLRKGMTAADAISVIVQLAAALAAAHGLGIVHRDLKPANVMMRGKVPVLTDFGIARDLSPDRTEITGDSILGTPNYMSPEQISGHPIDGRADIYSLGCMLYELLTGNRPYVGDSPIAVCMQHLQAPIPMLPEAFADLQPVLDGMMAKDREERFPDMASVVVELRAALEDSDALRQALKFDTDLPFSEQLRELGFSFDNTGNDQVRAALQASRAATQNSRETARTGRNTQRLGKAPKLPTPVDTQPLAPPPRRLGKREYVIGALLALVLLGVGLWWGLSEKQLSEGQLAGPRALTKQFDSQLAADRLVIPRDDSAADSLRGMYEISQDHPDVIAARGEFRNKVDAEFERLSAAGQFGEARILIQESALVFADEEVEQRLAKLETAQETQRRDGEVVTRLADVENLLNGALGINDPALGPALAELVALNVPTDPRYGDLINSISGMLSASLQQAVDARQLETAQAVRDRLRALLPDADGTRAAEAKVAALEALLGAEQTESDMLAQLNAGEITPAAIDRVLAGLDTLEQAKLAPAVAKVRGQLLARSLDAAKRALIANDLANARALVARVIGRFPEEVALRDFAGTLTLAENAALEQQRALEETQRAGRLALDASPWGEVVSVVGLSDGSEQPLASERTTPMLVTLPEGRYRVTIQGPDGRTRQQAEATVERGKLSVTELRFASLDADTYLKQAGYR